MTEETIRLSDKHGVNPSVGVCFWCGEDDGTVVLVGRLPNDAEAPRRAVYSYDPCDSCETYWSRGVALLECMHSECSDGQPPIVDNGAVKLYPTGRWIAVNEGLVRGMFTEQAAADVLKHRRAFIDSGVFENILKLTEDHGVEVGANDTEEA